MPRHTLVVFALAALLSACSALDPSPGNRDEAEVEAQRVKDSRAAVNLGSFDQMVVSRHMRVEAGKGDGYARVLALAAYFAAVVYREELSEDARSSPGQACARGASFPSLVAWPGIGEAGTARWERWDKPGLGCIADRGLYAEVHLLFRAPDQRPLAAVLAYRGTEGFSRAGLRDWLSNVSSPINVEPVQYVRAQRHLFSLVDAIRSEWGAPIPIFAVGHSLGGGLAQQAAYLSSAVSAAIVFNSSPVTNWTRLKYRDSVLQPGFDPSTLRNEDGSPKAPVLDLETVPKGFRVVEDPVVVRVHHVGEALEEVREMTTRLTARMLNRVDVELDLHIVSGEARHPFQSHSMRLLACALLERAANDRRPVADTEPVELLGGRNLPAFLPPDVARYLAPGATVKGGPDAASRCVLPDAKKRAEQTAQGSK